MLNSIGQLVQAQKETLHGLIQEREEIEQAFRNKQDQNRRSKEYVMDELARTQDDRLDVEKIRFEKIKDEYNKMQKEFLIQLESIKI